METKLVFQGSRKERLGKGNILNGEGGISAKVTLYAPDGTVDDTLIGYTMTSDAEKPFCHICIGSDYVMHGKRNSLLSYLCLCVGACNGRSMAVCLIV